jgi:gliding motility-associated-like protein
VALKECVCSFHYPNAFTPNYDNINPGFKGVPDCTKLRDYRLVVYNRWGEVLFETNDPAEEWDGTYKNKPVAQGAYGWFAMYSGNVNGIVERLKDAGTITVIR